VLFGNDCGIHYPAKSSDEFDVAAFLTGFNKTGRLEPTFNLPEGLRLKPRQPQPRSCAPSEGAWPEAARSEVPALPLGWQAPPLRTHPGWRCRSRGTAKRTNSLPARRSRRMHASLPHSCICRNLTCRAARDSTINRIDRRYSCFTGASWCSRLRLTKKAVRGAIRIVDTTTPTAEVISPSENDPPG
jgi:hypothetical protein